jgi:hypothetical protein
MTLRHYIIGMYGEAKDVKSSLMLAAKHLSINFLLLLLPISSSPCPFHQKQSWAKGFQNALKVWRGKSTAQFAGYCFRASHRRRTIESPILMAAQPQCSGYLATKCHLLYWLPPSETCVALSCGTAVSAAGSSIISQLGERTSV